MWLAFAGPEEWFGESCCVCQIFASRDSPHHFPRAQQACGGSPVHCRVEWLHRTIFSRQAQTLETAGALFIAFVCPNKCFGEHCFTHEDKVLPITLSRSALHLVAVALSSATSYPKRGGKNQPRTKLLEARRLPQTRECETAGQHSFLVSVHPSKSLWSTAAIVKSCQ